MMKLKRSASIAMILIFFSGLSYAQEGRTQVELSGEGWSLWLDRAADPTFTKHSQVINSFSDLMVDLFGESGNHARASVGMISLPGNIAVEIDMIVEVTD